MEPENLGNKELDKLVQDVLKSNDEFMIPSGLAEKTILKLEKKVLFRELILELAIKTGIVLGSLIVLATVMVLFNGTTMFSGFLNFLARYWQPVTSLVLLIFITILIDQVGIKFYTKLKREVSFKA